MTGPTEAEWSKKEKPNLSRGAGPRERQEFGGNPFKRVLPHPLSKTLGRVWIGAAAPIQTDQLGVGGSRGRFSLDRLAKTLLFSSRLVGGR